MRKFKIEIRENKIKLSIFYCLDFVKIKMDIKKTFIKMKSITVFEYFSAERHLESILE
jgi:hypothetical protein